MKKILITGIPGTGKTELGDYLHKHYHYEHIDLEKDENIKEFLYETNNFIAKLRQKDCYMIITWGFQPYWHAKFVRLLINEGFKHVWLDGDRTVAFDKFAERGTVDQQAFFNQLNNISSSKIVDILKPIILNPFKENGSFRNIEEIATEIIK